MFYFCVIGFCGSIINENNWNMSLSHYYKFFPFSCWQCIFAIRNGYFQGVESKSILPVKLFYDSTDRCLFKDWRGGRWRSTVWQLDHSCLGSFMVTFSNFMLLLSFMSIRTAYGGRFHPCHASPPPTLFPLKLCLLYHPSKLWACKWIR